MPEKEDTTEIESQALQIACPVCSAPKGEKCDPRIPGPALKETHLSRVNMVVNED